MTWRAKTLAAAAFALMVLAPAVGQKTHKEGSRELGHGYRLVHKVVDLGDCRDCFEKVAHYSDLYYRSRRIGKEIGQFDISPSGRFAIFEENGKLMLFERRTGRSRDVTDGTFAVPELVAWNEKECVVMVKYYEGHEVSVITLAEHK